MIYTVYPTSRFRKDAERAKKRGRSMTELEDVIDKLSRDEPLEIKHRDHKLEGGKYEGCRECHINPDWLLIYKKEAGKMVLALRRTRTHSDLF